METGVGLLLLDRSSLWNFKTVLDREEYKRKRKRKRRAVATCSLSYGSGHMILTLDSWNLLIFLISLPNLRTLDLFTYTRCFVFWHLYCVVFFYIQYVFLFFSSHVT